MIPKFFKTQTDFRKWLVKNHDKETEIWVGFYKKASGKIAMNYDQALDEALCFGWIDGVVNKYNEESYAQRFTPRTKKSNWSKINVGHVERLTKAGLMMPTGLLAVEAARQDGRWDRAYQLANAEIPADFLKELKKNKKAEEFFQTLNKANKFHIAFQLLNAKKEETRARRMKKMIEQLEREEKFY